MKPFHAIHNPDTPISHLPFSPAVQVGQFVFVSGQASVDETGKIVPDTFAGEMRRSLENIRKVLAAAGLTMNDVVQTRNYVGDQADLPEFNQIYAEYFEQPYPARTTLMGCLGTLLKYEVDVVAVAPRLA
ncbi:RidA family protein [Blastopirellula marina]|uniref:Endoribonuclease L-PSP n=1 Tax=Blastopirellula marina DSM 3645 TaxID=314230 RepID=A3ZYZ1_9BACT|nr:RidA family protein [Blastopirellula marina]EAQ78356.1 endoribonuclease L-PSP [Blastopirellula marina DSM 3645]